MKSEMKSENKVLVMFRVSEDVASAMDAVSNEEFITRSDVARRAIVFDLRRRGLLAAGEREAVHA
jgi:hypothetical protein